MVQVGHLKDKTKDSGVNLGDKKHHGMKVEESCCLLKMKSVVLLVRKEKTWEDMPD